MKPRSLVFASVAAMPLAVLYSEPAACQAVGTFGPVTIEASRSPTRNLPGYSTWTLSASSDLGIRAFDFVGNRDSQFGDPDAYGFFGPMNQLTAAGMPTPWDLGCFECDQGADSYFLVSPASVVVPAGVTSESSTHLRSAFANSTPFPDPFEFVQLVRADASPEPIHIRCIVVVGPLDNLQEILITGTIPIPEPASAVLLVTTMLGVRFILNWRRATW